MCVRDYVVDVVSAVVVSVLVVYVGVFGVDVGGVVGIVGSLCVVVVVVGSCSNVVVAGVGVGVVWRCWCGCYRCCE